MTCAGLPPPFSVRGTGASLFCICLFLFINPFLALFLTAVVSLYYRVSYYAFLASASVSFTLFFFLREYGVEWYLNSTDDIPQYISLYESNSGLSFTELLGRFVSLPSGHEPLWHIPNWILLNWFSASSNTYLFVQYLAIFLTLFFALKMISSRFLIPFAAIYFFLTPISVDAVAHIWRQQFASSMLLAGIGLYFIHEKKSGKWLVYTSSLIHLSFLFYGVIFFVTEWIRTHGGFDNKKKFSLQVVITLLAVPWLLSLAIPILDSIGFTKILVYYEGYGVDFLRVYLILGTYAIAILASYYFMPIDTINKHLLMLCLVVFGIVLALPAANSIYDRMLMFVLPLWGLYFSRILFFQSPKKWRLPVLTIVFISGVLRLHAPVSEGYGVAKFLAFGNAFDPFMGTLRCLFLL